MCSHPQRAAVDAEIVADVPFRTIAAPRGLSHVAVLRHAAAHIPTLLLEARDEELRELADSLLGRVMSHLERAGKLHDAAVAILEEQRERDETTGKIRTKDAAIALSAIRTATHALGRESELLELLGRVTGELRDTQVNVVIMPEWVELRARIVAALAPYPEALVAVKAALALPVHEAA